MNIRICKGCGKEYPETSEFFHKQPTGKNGLSGKCKKCIYTQTKELKRKQAKERVSKYKPVDSLEGEIWKDAKGYEGLYQVSNLGRVKSLSRVKGSAKSGFRISKEFIRKQIKDTAGYPRVELSKNKSKKLWAVHRLVATTFIPNPNNYPFVNHKDETRDNNNMDNLEWCTCEYNNNYGTRNERLAKIKGTPVYQYSLGKKLIKKWISSQQCLKGGYVSTTVREHCINGKPYKGYIWSYKPLVE